MKLRIAAGFFCWFFGPFAHAGSWEDLWRTPDQQAQQALEAGDAQRAAKLFTDPRRRAYAETQSKHYEEAAKQLAPFDDAVSQYNRGNALAHGSDLQAALKAYDSALKTTPENTALHRDAQHNRDLVASRLKDKKDQQKNGQQNSKSSPKDGNNDSKQPHSDAADSKQSQGADSDESQSKQAQQSPSKDQSPSKSAQSKEAQQPQPGPSDPKQGEQSQSNPADSKQSQQPAQNNASSPSDAEQAKRDAAEAMKSASQRAARQPDQSGAERKPNSASGSAGDDTQKDRLSPPPPLSTKPPTEQSLALDQWLRQIPDDPGGLLRRKFLIEHMMKEREGQP